MKLWKRQKAVGGAWKDGVFNMVTLLGLGPGNCKENGQKKILFPYCIILQGFSIAKSGLCLERLPLKLDQTDVRCLFFCYFLPSFPTGERSAESLRSDLLAEQEPLCEQRTKIGLEAKSHTWRVHIVNQTDVKIFRFLLVFNTEARKCLSKTWGEKALVRLLFEGPDSAGESAKDQQRSASFDRERRERPDCL